MDEAQKKEMIEVVGMGKDIHYIKEAFQEFKRDTNTELKGIRAVLESFDGVYVRRDDYLKTIDWANRMKLEADQAHKDIWKAIDRLKYYIYAIVGGIILLGFLIQSNIIGI